MNTNGSLNNNQVIDENKLVNKTANYFIGFQKAEDPSQWLKAFERSLADFLPLLPTGDFKMGIIDFVIKIIGGAVTFALIAVALRRRLKEDVDINDITKEKITSPCLIGGFILKSNSKRDEIHHMSLFPNEDILTKEIESWKGFANSLSSKEDRELFQNMLNDCYEYTAAINATANHFQPNH